MQKVRDTVVLKCSKRKNLFIVLSMLVGLCSHYASHGIAVPILLLSSKLIRKRALLERLYVLSNL